MSQKNCQQTCFSELPVQCSPLRTYRLSYCYCIKKYSGVTMTQNQRHSISLCSSNSLSVLSCTQKLSCDTGTVSLPLLSSEERLEDGGTLEFGMAPPRLFASAQYTWYTRLEDLRASRLSYSLVLTNHWFSGKFQRCHRWVLGSIPGKSFAFLKLLGLPRLGTRLVLEKVLLKG